MAWLALFLAISRAVANSGRRAGVALSNGSFDTWCNGFVVGLSCECSEFEPACEGVCHCQSKHHTPLTHTVTVHTDRAPHRADHLVACCPGFQREPDPRRRRDRLDTVLSTPQTRNYSHCEICGMIRVAGRHMHHSPARAARAVLAELNSIPR